MANHEKKVGMIQTIYEFIATLAQCTSRIWSAWAINSRTNIGRLIE